MRSFEDAWKQNRHVWESTKCLAQAMYLAGHESRQTEVDELKQHIKRLELKLDEIGSDRQGLVGQVYAVKQLIQEYHQHSYREADDFVFYLEQALKGES